MSDEASALDALPVRRSAARTRNPRPPSPTALRRAEEVKAAAALHFHRYGFHGSDLRTVASELGWHPSSLYNYVSSKQQLLYIVARDDIDGLACAFDAATASVSNPVAAVDAAIRAHVAWACEQRIAHAAVLTEARRLEGEFLADYERRTAAYRARWEALLERGLSRQMFRPIRTRLIALGLLGMLDRLANWYDPGAHRTPAQIADVFSALVLTGLLAPRERLRRAPRPLVESP